VYTLGSARCLGSCWPKPLFSTIEKGITWILIRCDCSTIGYYILVKSNIK
jgi:hypothetical protein